MILLFDEVTKVKCKRGGIIPYIKKDGEIYFLMGVDSKTRELSEFGGGITKNESILIGSIREFMEESKEIISPSSLKPVSCAIFDRRNDICILFCEISDSSFFEQAHSLFHSSQIVNIESDEMCDIVWISLQDMIKNIYSQESIIWNRIKYTLANNGDFNDQLIAML